MCGKDAYEKQLEYLENTRKPFDMSMLNYAEKCEEINGYLPLLDEGESSLTLEQLNKRVWCKSLAGQDLVEYLQRGGKRITDYNEIADVLSSIEEARELNSFLQEKKKNKNENFKKRNNNNNNNTD